MRHCITHKRCYRIAIAAPIRVVLPRCVICFHLGQPCYLSNGESAGLIWVLYVAAYFIRLALYIKSTYIFYVIGRKYRAYFIDTIAL